MRHIIRTEHIQRLIKNALTLAETVDGKEGSHNISWAEIHEAKDVWIPMPEGSYRLEAARPEDALEKAIADLRHAADELDAERLSCKGWPQV